jgi:hypothetical protein
MLNIANISQELKIWYEGLVLLLRAGNYDYSSNFNKNKTFLPRHGSSEPDSHRIPPRSVHNTQVQHKPKANLYEVRTQSTLSPQNGEQTRSIVVSNPQPYTNSSGSHRTRTVQLYNQTNMTYPALTLDQSPVGQFAVPPNQKTHEARCLLLPAMIRCSRSLKPGKSHYNLQR